MNHTQRANEVSHSKDECDTFDITRTLHVAAAVCAKLGILLLRRCAPFPLSEVVVFILVRFEVHALRPPPRHDRGTGERPRGNGMRHHRHHLKPVMLVIFGSPTGVGVNSNLQ